MKLRKLIFTVSAFLFSICSILGQNFSYSTKGYSTQNKVKTDIKNHGNYISFPPYLFEFNITLQMYDELHAITGHKTSPATFDTGSVYVIDAAKKIFFEFNSFEANAKIISSGPLQDKKFGVSITENAEVEAATGLTEDLLRDTVAFGKKLSYYPSVEKNANNQDSVITCIFFLKQPNFISIHDIPNRLVKDRLYSMVGFHLQHLELDESASVELEELRALSELEEKICDGMIKTMLAFKKEH